ncbi:glycosyltransferase family 4 protein [Candidatus Uabimicrobium sp. HlEnr_7]|uniref:glycosyltransferase family 4 protein n=1 Tax=Candidatus Uabimicrobium helgolandensis TaxID=3095367 RepID=UPI003558816F
MKNKIRVCFISHSSQKLGAERSLLETITLLRKNIIPFVILPKKGPLCVELEKKNICYVIIPYSWWVTSKISLWKTVIKFFLNISMTFYIVFQIKKWRCDLVYSNTIATCVGALAAKLSSRPHIWHIREYGFEDHGLIFEWGKQRSTKLIYQLSSHCIFNSKAVRKKYLKYFPQNVSKKHSVFYQPVMLHFGKTISLSKVRKNCMILGAIRESKGQAEAIEAIRILKEQYNCHINLYILGDGIQKYVDLLKSKVIQYDLEANIFFIGHVDFPASWLSQADITLVCSHNEAFGRVAVESFLLKKPTIGTSSGGTLELISSQNGLLYSPGNTSELAEKIHTLLVDNQLCKTIANNGHNWVKQNISQEIYVQKLLNIMCTKSSSKSHCKMKYKY